MDYYTILGMVAAALTAVAAFYTTQKRSIKDDVRKEAEAYEKNAKEMQNLNENIIKLNVNFENMMKSDEVRDSRIAVHGKEIDKHEYDIHDMKNELSNHESRLLSLEDWRKKND